MYLEHWSQLLCYTPWYSKIHPCYTKLGLKNLHRSLQRENQTDLFRENQGNKTMYFWNIGASCSATPHGIPRFTHATPSRAPETQTHIFQCASSGQKNRVFGALEAAVLIHPKAFQDPPMLHQAGPQKTRQMLLNQQARQIFSESIRAKEPRVWSTGANCFATPHGTGLPCFSLDPLELCPSLVGS